jgi:hypothetical protein
MHIAVLLLSLEDIPRRTSFTRDWAERCVTVAGEFYAAQSAGRVSITWQVFDWLALAMDEDEWVTLSGKGIDGVVDLVTPMLPDQTDLKQGFDHILVGIDSPNSSGGTTPGTYTYLGAVNFTPSMIGHEFGHRFGASDAFGTAAAGRRRYEDNYCVMGAMNWPYTYADSRLVADEAPGLAETGPGMSAPTLMATGWLDPAQHNLVDDLTGSAAVYGGGTLVTLSALTGSPGVVWDGPPLAVRYHDYVIEYRIAAAWDHGIPVPDGARGRIVAHRSPVIGPVAEFVDAVADLPGAMMSLGRDDILDIDSPGPLVIRVLSVDPISNQVQLSLSRRAARPGPESVGVGPGYGGDGGGWVWTPGRGLQRIPPYSPLNEVLQTVGELASLHELASSVPRDQTAAIQLRADTTLHSLRESVGRVTAEAPLAPSEQATASLRALDDARRRYETEIAREGAGREYLEASRAAVEQLTAVIEAAARR